MARINDSSGRPGYLGDLIPCGLKKRTGSNDSSHNSDTISETDVASSSCRLIIRSPYVVDVTLGFNVQVKYVAPRLIVTGFEKTLLVGFFVKIEFDASLISSTIELTHLQVLD